MENMLWFKVPESVYFKSGILSVALTDLKDKGVERVQIVTGKTMMELGYVKMVSDILVKYGMKVNIYDSIKPDPTLSCIMDGVENMNRFDPDCIVAIGGGSPMDASKIMRLMYEHPDIDFKQLYIKFMDIRKRIVEFPNTGDKIKQLVCIPTTSGTGAEVTPFAVITDDSGGQLRKYPIADYALTPNMAIVDPQLTKTMPRGLTAMTGMDALTHALESHVSICSTDYTRTMSLQAAKLVFENLEKAYVTPTDIGARENMHNASTIAGMAFANAFLGICHSIAHQLGHVFKIPHGLANALMISHVVRYNACNVPTKRTAFPQYDHYKGIEQYADVARFCKLTNSTNDEECVRVLVEHIEDLKRRINIPKSIQEYGISEDDFLHKLDDVVIMAYDDQCTGANPRHPLFAEIRQLLVDAYYGTSDHDSVTV
jgi:acetaldehyde dehydrogenase/alcohol dehydrogenase